MPQKQLSQDAINTGKKRLNEAELVIRTLQMKGFCPVNIRVMNTTQLSNAGLQELAHHLTVLISTAKTAVMPHVKEKSFCIGSFHTLKRM